MPRKNPPAAPGSSSRTDATPAPGNSAELDALRQELAASAPAETLPPPSPEPPAGQPQDSGDRTAEGIEEILSDPAALEARLSELGEEDLADTLQLAFGLAAEQWGEECELSDPRARRLARWGKRVLDRHPDWLPWIRQNLPEVMFCVLISWEIFSRWRLVQKRKGDKTLPATTAAATAESSLDAVIAAARKLPGTPENGRLLSLLEAERARAA